MIQIQQHEQQIKPGDFLHPYLLNQILYLHKLYKDIWEDYAIYIKQNNIIKIKFIEYTKVINPNYFQKYIGFFNVRKTSFFKYLNTFVKIVKEDERLYNINKKKVNTDKITKIKQNHEIIKHTFPSHEQQLIEIDKMIDTKIFSVQHDHTFDGITLYQEKFFEKNAPNKNDLENYIKYMTDITSYKYEVTDINNQSNILTVIILTSYLINQYKLKDTQESTILKFRIKIMNLLLIYFGLHFEDNKIIFDYSNFLSIYNEENSQFNRKKFEEKIIRRIDYITRSNTSNNLGDESNISMDDVFYHEPIKEDIGNKTNDSGSENQSSDDDSDEIVNAEDPDSNDDSDEIINLTNDSNYDSDDDEIDTDGEIINPADNHDSSEIINPADNSHNDSKMNNISMQKNNNNSEDLLKLIPNELINDSPKKENLKI